MSSAISSVTSTTSATDAASELVAGRGSRTLSQDDFLRLLVAQMSSQDPLNPQTDTQMAAQMAQFTALQQSGTMSDNIATMLKQQEVLQANGMLGGTVTLQVDPKTTATGIVEAVQLDGGIPKIVVNGVAYELSQVIKLTSTPITLPANAAN
jgi:flagellar basal-body rod modification protein FlgD